MRLPLAACTAGLQRKTFRDGDGGASATLRHLDALLNAESPDFLHQQKYPVAPVGDALIDLI